MFYFGNLYWMTRIDTMFYLLYYQCEAYKKSGLDINGKLLMDPLMVAFVIHIVSITTYGCYSHSVTSQNVVVFV